MDNIIELEHVCKQFQIGTQEVMILKDVSYVIRRGDFLIIFGPSGCGKSTMLHTILGLEPPTTGVLKFMGEDLYKGRTEDMVSKFRKKHIGMTYQQSNWIKSLNVLENVSLPLILLGYPTHDAYNRALQVLKDIGVESWATYVPTELSSGQQQKVSLARALINDPDVIVADEPTGNLDFKSGQEVMELLVNLNKTKGKTIIMVTHDLEYLIYATRVVQVFDGKIAGIYEGDQIEKVLSTLKLKRGSQELLGEAVK